MSKKQGIIDNFKFLAKYYEVSTEKNAQYRRKAYENAVRALKNLELEEITSVKQVLGIPNIGATTREKINEYLITGKMVKVEELREEIEELAKLKSVLNMKERQLNNIASIKYIGKSGAEKLWEKGIRSVEDLQKNPRILNYKQQIGLKYYKYLSKPIPRNYITIFYMMCQYVLAKKFGLNKYKMNVLGSYKRGLAFSGDIDFIVSSDTLTLRDIVQVLIDWKIIVEVIDLQYGNKFTGIAHCPNGDSGFIFLDIVFVPIESWGAATLTYTGSKLFVQAMRADAAKLGYFLNHLGLFKRNSDGKAGQRVPANTEKEIFNHLGMKWIPPEKR